MNTDMNYMIYTLSETVMAEYRGGEINKLLFNHYQYDKKITLRQVVLSNECICKNENKIKKYEDIKIEDLLMMIENGDDMLSMPLLVPKILDHFKGNEICSICMEEILGDCYKTVCSHHFHHKCVAEFLNQYYKDLMWFALLGKEYSTEYDIYGNVTTGGEYKYCCPNCKNESFKLTIQKNGKEFIILNKENCIYDW